MQEKTHEYMDKTQIKNLNLKGTELQKHYAQAKSAYCFNLQKTETMTDENHGRVIDTNWTVSGPVLKKWSGLFS